MPNPLRYVVLHHTGYGEAHFDLMFETAPGSPLATWRARAWPLDGTALEPLADHRAAYLEYEGPVSNGRGEVRRVAGGTHRVLHDGPRELVVLMDESVTLHLPRRA